MANEALTQGRDAGAKQHRSPFQPTTNPGSQGCKDQRPKAEQREMAHCGGCRKAPNQAWLHSGKDGATIDFRDIDHEIQDGGRNSKT